MWPAPRESATAFSSHLLPRKAFVASLSSSAHSLSPSVRSHAPLAFCPQRAGFGGLGSLDDFFRTVRCYPSVPATALRFHAMPSCRSHTNTAIYVR